MSQLVFCRYNIPFTSLYHSCRYFITQKRNLDDGFPLWPYLKDGWNFMDWLNYIFLTLHVIIHVISLTTPLTLYVLHCIILYCTTQMLTLFNSNAQSSRFLSIGLIFSWMRIMKLARAYPTFGPFVVMLGEMVGDTVWSYYPPLRISITNLL